MEATRVAAPPFAETARGAWLADGFATFGLTDVHTDEVGNVSAFVLDYASRL